MSSQLRCCSVVACALSVCLVSMAQQTFAGIAADPQGANRQLHLLWIGCGTDDGLFGASESFSKFLDNSQIKRTFFKIPGAHTWIVWRQFLNEFAPRLFLAQ